MRRDIVDERFLRIVPGGSELETVAGGLGLCEGPVWSPADGALHLTDLGTDSIWRWRRGLGLVLTFELMGRTSRHPPKRGCRDGAIRRFLGAWYGDCHPFKRHKTAYDLMANGKQNVCNESGESLRRAQVAVLSLSRECLGRTAGSPTSRAR